MDTRTLYKGAAAIRKGHAMFAWLKDVEAALTEVGDLEKALPMLQVRASKLSDDCYDLDLRLENLRGQVISADAQARKVKEVSDVAVAAITTQAQEEAAAVVQTAKKQADKIYKAIKKERDEWQQKSEKNTNLA